MKPVITAHNKKLSSENTVPPCSCKINNKSQLNEKCRTRNILCKCVALTSMKPVKVYLETTERNFKQRSYHRKNSFKNNAYRNYETNSK